jgi:hypothetical protein
MRGGKTALIVLKILRATVKKKLITRATRRLGFLHLCAEVNLFVLNYPSQHEDVCWSINIAPRIPNDATWWRT